MTLGSGWFIHPGKLKLRVLRGLQRLDAGSGWFIHPGKLKLDGEQLFTEHFTTFRMVYPSGEVETVLAM